MFALDVEALGLSVKHGARPFYVTVAFDDNTQKFYEWPVDVYTRKVLVDQNDLREIKNLVSVVTKWGRDFGADRNSDHCIVGHNIKYDVSMLMATEGWDIEWPWELTNDTLIASHILYSIGKHNLTDLGITYLKEDISPYEETLKQCVVKCRNKVKRNYPDWLIANEDLIDEEGNYLTPSAKTTKASKSGDKDTKWKYDMWICKAVALEEDLPVPVRNCEHEFDETSHVCNFCKGHHYHTVLEEYSNADSAITLLLWRVLERELREQGLWEIYLHQMKLPRIVSKMESRGVTMSMKKMKELEKDFTEESQRLESVCVNIAKSKGYSLKLPKGGRNDALNDFVFNGLGLESEKQTKKGNASMDKHVLDSWSNTLPLRSMEKLFIDSLISKRARDTSLTYIKSYKKFAVEDYEGNCVLYPSANITGTNTTRFSSQNPNSSQISKLEKTNLRRGFCPGNGRFFVSMDAQNIELRIPAYEADEKDMIYIFEHSKDPPYYGSYHLLIFDLLHPELFKEHGKAVKTLYEDTFYQWIKNGNFARQYGAQKKKVDETYRVPGGYDLVRYRFPKIAKLNDDMIKYAGKHGYVECLRNKTINCKRGYPLVCSRTNDNHVLPTVPLSYHVQGSAGIWLKSAIIKCGEYLDTVPDHFMILTVHDELVFDMPRGNNTEKPWEDSLPVINRLSELMESCGKEIGIPTPVTREAHPDSWAVGISI